MAVAPDQKMKVASAREVPVKLTFEAGDTRVAVAFDRIGVGGSSAPSAPPIVAAPTLWLPTRGRRSSRRPDIEPEPSEHRTWGPFLTAADIPDDDQETSWLWPERLPRGGVTSLEGMPGDGKSTISMDLAARVTIGASMPFDDRAQAPGGVVVFNVEDTKIMVKRRAEAAGADLGRLVILGAEAVGLFGDLPRLEAAMDAVDAKLIIADPFMAALGKGTNAKNDQSVRQELTPLADVLARRGAGVLAIRHPTKGASGDPRYTGSGAVGVTAALRSVLAVSARADHPDQYVLTHVKTNWGQRARPIAYRIAPAGKVGRVDWIGEVKEQAA